MRCCCGTLLMSSMTQPPKARLAALPAIKRANFIPVSCCPHVPGGSARGNSQDAKVARVAGFQQAAIRCRDCVRTMHGRFLLFVKKRAPKSTRNCIKAGVPVLPPTSNHCLLTRPRRNSGPGESQRLPAPTGAPWHLISQGPDQPRRLFFLHGHHGNRDGLGIADIDEVADRHFLQVVRIRRLDRLQVSFRTTQRHG